MELIISQRIRGAENKFCTFNIIAYLSAVYLNTVFYRYNLHFFTAWYILHQEELMQIFPFHVERFYYIHP